MLIIMHVFCFYWFINNDNNDNGTMQEMWIWNTKICSLHEHEVGRGGWFRG